MHQSVDRRFSARLHDSMFGNDGGDESSRGDVEGGVESLSPGGCDRDTPIDVTSDPSRSSISISSPEAVDRSTVDDGAGDNEGDAGCVAGKGDRDRSDLVRRVSVPRDAIRSNDRHVYQ